MRFKRRAFILLVIVLLCLVLSACNKSSNNYKELEYKFFTIQQQGWKSKRVDQFVGDISYSATEVPIQYYLLKNNKDKSIKVDSLYKNNERERVVEVEFQHVNQSDLLLKDYTKKPYTDAVNYMAFNIVNDFTLITSSNDTIKCSGVNFERNFKLAPFKRILLYFNNVNPSDNIKLIYQDHLFGNGILKFNFNETPIKL